MIVHIPLAGRPELLESDNFRQLMVLGDPTPHHALGRPDGAHVYLDPEELKRLAGADASDPDWQQRFTEMVAFAAASGWVDENGYVRAHVKPLT